MENSSGSSFRLGVSKKFAIYKPMNINKFFNNLLILFLGFNLSVFASEVTGYKDASKAVKKKVLMAIQESQFKKAVILKVKKSLQEDGHSVKIINLKELSAESTDNYQAIVIVNTCQAWRLNGHVRKFLKNIPEDEREKIVLFTTANSKSWRPKLTGVNAITSASKMSEVDHIADSIINMVRILLEPK